MTGYALLLLTSLLTCAGQICQKQAADRWQLFASRQEGPAVSLGWLAGAALLLGFGMLAWLEVLRRLPVSLAYPMLSLNFVLVTLAARFIFGEAVSSRHWSGVAAIMAGIFLMGISQ